MISTNWISGGDHLEDAFYIRTEVFIKEQGVPKELEMDELDEVSEHLVVYENNKPIATGRLVYQNGQYLLGRIAVLKSHRGGGIGDFVVRLLIRRAFSKGAEEVHIHAQVQVKDFYERLDFTSYGEIYEEAGIPHINMVRKGDISGHCC